MKSNKNRSFISVLKAPKRNFDDFFDEAAYLLAYRMAIFLTAVLGILGVILTIDYGIKFSIFSFIGFFVVLLSVIHIRKTGKYKSFTLYFNLFGAVMCLITLFAIEGQPHLLDGLWMIINILFTFMSVGKKWGVFIALVHGISLSMFYLFRFNAQIPLIHNLTNDQLFGISVNVFLCFMIIFYLSYQNIKTNQYAQNNLKEAREKLQLQFDTINKQNEEKTMMLKEIHHRVKNNLQVITSLLRLQSRELENEEAISKFQETTNRVIAMSMIHEKMYQSDELSKINIEDYFNSLSNDLLNSYQVAFPIEIKIFCSIETLGMTPIVPLALIFNELLSNSLKYAFSENQEAKIDIKLQKMDQDNFVLTYQDNGTWKIPVRQDSFGMELIDALTEQLEGEMSFSNKPVTKYIFKFPNLES
jgi:two-component sensor histidine kinase